jgi:hypothetical protein
MECSGIQYLRGAPEALQQWSVLIMKSAHIGPLSAKTPQAETAKGPEHPACCGRISYWFGCFSCETVAPPR